MSRIDDMVKNLCPKGIEYKTLGEIGTFIRGNGLQKKDFVDSGVGCIHYGQIYTYYGTFTSKTRSFVNPDLASHLCKVSPGDLVIACTSENIEDVCKAVAWLGTDNIVTGGHACVFKHNQNPKYIAYFFQTESFFVQKKKYARGTKVIDIKTEDLAKIMIPIPPLQIQEEIVKILESFTLLEENLEKELNVRKKQFFYYRKKLLSCDGKLMNIGDIGPVCMCKRILKSETSANGEVPFYKIGTFGKHPDAYISQSKYEEYKRLYPFPKKGEVLLSAAGTIGRAVVYDGSPAYYQDSNIVWIANNESVVLNKYLFYCYSLEPWNVSNGGTIARLYNSNLARAKIRVPTLNEQKRIVSILDKFDALINDSTCGLPAELKTRRQQYKYYRERLLSFPINQ